MDNESASLAALPAGTYYVGVIADSTKLIGEASETNNTASLKVTVGGPGNDTITSSVGADILIGGGGADHFVYQSKNAGLDQILDFTQGTDKLDFASSVFGKHLAQGNANTGTLDASHFVANGTGPTNALQVFWFDTNHSTLNYDANGSNGAAPVPIAHLLGVATLTSDDIHLI